MSNFSCSSASKSSRPKLIRRRGASASVRRTLLLLLLAALSCLHATRSAAESSDVIAPLPSRQQQAKRRGARDNSSSSSELNYEFLDLRSIPTQELCEKHQVGQHINSISFASNQIDSIGADAFGCVASGLRILNLRRNKIESVARDAFGRLDQLQVLLLDGNRLRRVPSRSLEALTSLRHLNLASNRIESIGGPTNEPRQSAAAVEVEEDQLQNKNLISLNLKSNPLRRIAPSAFKQLVRLKTLILSETQLELGGANNKANSSKLIPLEGLNELRFLHLDHLARGPDDAPPALDRDFCSHSRRLTSLILRSNGLAEVPQFSDCQNLLQLDLTFNRIAGSLDGHFRLQVNLIDLYLANNLIESVEEEAFVGLGRLQVLNLQQNRLKFIHSRAFVPLGASLVELNVAQNGELDSLPSAGLESQLKHLRAFGNHNLRTLPRLRAIESLALTYAYHCCDYQVASEANISDSLESAPLESADGEAATGDMLLKLRHFFNYFSASTRQEHGERPASSLHDGDEYPQHSVNLKNLSELIVWPPPLLPPLETTTTIVNDGNLTSSGLRARRRRETARAGAALWTVDSHSVPEDKSDEVTSASRRARLIDELARQLARIRHSNLNERPQESAWQLDDDELLMEFQVPTSSDTSGAHEHEDEPLVARQIGLKLASFYDKRLRAKRRTNHAARDAAESSVAPARNDIQCQPRPSAFMPCRDLFDHWWLRSSVWLVFLCAFLGNILVIVVLTSVRANSSSALTSIMWFQAHSKRHIDVPRFLVINLAIADLLMAGYLGLLVAVDLATWNKFKYFAIKWQYSAGCRAAGFLAVLSSELSVFILAIITLERNYAITNAVHLNRRLSLQKAMLIMLLGYSFALLMAAAPLNGVSDYRKFAICLPGLDFHSNLRSQVYLIALISINTFSFLLLLGCYLRMYCAIRGSQAWNTNDLRIAKRMSILVLTDFLCWMPIILVSVSSLFGHHLIGPNGLKVLTVFVLPLNSVANPFLYAITTKKFKRDLVTLRRRFSSLVCSVVSQCCCCGWLRGKQSLAALNEASNANNNNNDHHLRLHLNDNKLLFNRKYEGNLMAGQLNCNKGKRCKSKQPTAVTNGRLDKASRRRFKFDDNDEENRRNHADHRQLFNTNNQVTVNRTTCSCGGRGQRDATSAAAASQFPTVNRRQVAIQVKLDGSSHLADPSDCNYLDPNGDTGGPRQLRPKIVLDVAVEPTLDVALVPLGLSCCELARRRSPQVMSRLIRPQPSADSIDAASSNRPTSTAADRQLDGTTLAPTICVKQKSLQSIQTSSPRQQHSDDQLRPHSANSTNGQLSSHLASPSAQHQSHVSCQAILISSRHVASSSLVSELSSQPGSTRSASACGHGLAKQKQEEAKVTRSMASMNRLGNHTCCSTPATCLPAADDCCASRNDQSPGSRADDRSSWRSINRLFSPLIKTWSSIQLSLNQQQSKQANSNQPASTDNENDQPTGTSTVNDDEELDILQLSSPARRRLLRNNERRMSKSCELITNKPDGDDDSVNVKSSLGINEPSSSQYDASDDQRILLATINRMAGERSNQPQLIEFDSNQQQNKRFRGVNSLGRRCKRCRSWSPALLDKLEDCMYQIKSKIPNFNFGTARQSVCHEQMEPSEFSESNDYQESGEVGCEDKTNVLVDLDDSSSASSCEDTNPSGRNRGKDADDDLEEDSLHELGLMQQNWSKRRANSGGQSVRQSRHRLRQQSSANSDTLSIRTAGTVLTNVSDSSSSILVENPNETTQESKQAKEEEETGKPQAQR